MSAHLVVDVTGHGYGHFAQVAPVVSALRARLPTLRVTLRTAVPAAVVREALDDGKGEAGDRGVTLAPPPRDIGLVMTGPLDVDRAASAAAYADLHREWCAVVADEGRRLAALRPDVLLSDVAYTSLAGAAWLGVPAVALSSLNWADLYHCYCGDQPQAARIHAEIVAAYAGARLFIQVTPHLPMTDLPNCRSVGPVALIAPDRRAALNARLNTAADARLVLVTLGGIDMNDEVRALPRLPGVRWIVASGVRPARDDVSLASELGFRFSELIRACDAVVTKPGYGTIVEAVCSGTGILYCDREDWPETRYLDAWAKRHGRAALIPRSALADGTYGSTLTALLTRPGVTPPAATGVQAAADLIAELLS